METSLEARTSGTMKKILEKAGGLLDAKDLIMVIGDGSDDEDESGDKEAGDAGEKEDA